MWVRHDVLAAAGPVATSGGVEAAPHRAAHRTPAPRRTRPGPRRCGQCIAPRRARGKKTGPNPTDRRKAGSKHHVLTDAHGIPLVAILTAANRHDVTQLLPLVDAFPTLRGLPRRPATQAPARSKETAGTTRSPIATNSSTAASRRNWPSAARPHGSGLGRTRWVVERTMAWLHRFRRLAVRYERRPCVHEAFLSVSLLAHLLVLLETRHLISQRALSTSGQSWPRYASSAVLAGRTRYAPWWLGT